MEVLTQQHTEKIPDFIMLKLMYQERGKLLSHIDELEFTLEKMKQLSEADLRNVKKQTLIRHLNSRIAEIEIALELAKEENKRIKAHRDDLLSKSLCRRPASIEPHVIF